MLLFVGSLHLTVTRRDNPARLAQCYATCDCSRVKLRYRGARNIARCLMPHTSAGFELCLSLQLQHRKVSPACLLQCLSMQSRCSLRPAAAAAIPETEQPAMQTCLRDYILIHSPNPDPQFSAACPAACAVTPPASRHALPATYCQPVHQGIQLLLHLHTASFACVHSISIRHLQVHSTRTCLVWTLWV